MYNPVVVVGSDDPLTCCWTCQDQSNWDPVDGWTGGWEWGLVCGYSPDGGQTVFSSYEDMYLGRGTKCNVPCPDSADCARPYPGLGVGNVTFEELEQSYNNYTKAKRLTDKQGAWGRAQLRRGCVGIAAAAVGTTMLFTSCWKTRAQAKTEFETLAKLDGCCPVMYGVQLWNDIGRDGVRPDVLYNRKRGGRAVLSNWDEQDSSGTGHGHFNFGTMINDDYILWADNMHNPDDGTGHGAHSPGEPVMHMTATLRSVSTFNGFLKGADPLYNLGLWCVRCQGRFE